MKVKVITYSDTNVFEEAVNDFIVDKHVIDIKFSTVVNQTSFVHLYSNSALIMYED